MNGFYGKEKTESEKTKREKTERPVITLTTDFGDIYPARMKGRILAICPEATVIDISHNVPPGNIRWGAFVLNMCAADFPKGTIHTAVVDPGVGTDRKPLLIRNRKTEQYFIGPDNGLLAKAAGAAEKECPPDVFVIDEKLAFLDGVNEDVPHRISPTFHGKDIFAPAAAALAAGIPPERIGTKISPTEISGLPAPENTVRFSDGAAEIATAFLMADAFGNIITSFPEKELPGGIDLDAAEISVMGLSASFVRTYGDAPRGTLLLLWGSHENLEIAVSEGSAISYFEKRRVPIGENVPVTVKIVPK